LADLALNNYRVVFERFICIYNCDEFVKPFDNSFSIMAAALTGLTACLVCRGRPKMYAALWGGLADGASPEGVPFGGSGKPILRCVAGHAANLPPDTYLNSLSR
jgi:hypothetical protein